MTHPRPLHFDANATANALLKRYKALNAETVCAQINDCLARGGDVFYVTQEPRKGRVSLLSDTCEITLTSHKRRLPRSAVSAALACPWAKQRTPNYDRAFDSHTSFVEISVTHSASATSGSLSPLTLAARLQILKAALDAVQDATQPALVHWHQSDMVFVPSELAQSFGTTLPIDMIVHPLPLPKSKTGTQDSQTALIAHGSDLVLGEVLCIDALPGSAQDVVDLAHVILHQHDAGRIDLAHGDALTTRGGQVLFVRHIAPDSHWPTGRICIGTAKPRTRDIPPQNAHSGAKPGAPTAAKANGFQDRIARLSGSPVQYPKEPELLGGAATKPKLPEGAAKLLMSVAVLLVIGAIGQFYSQSVTSFAAAEITTTELRAKN